MNAKATAASDAWYAHPVDKTSQTDDQRIKDITVLPPPEHLIRFFPIRGTPVERLIGDTRRSIRGFHHPGREERSASVEPVATGRDDVVRIEGVLHSARHTPE